MNNGKEENKAKKPFTGMGGAKLRYLNLYRTTFTPQPICPERQGTKVFLLDELVLIGSEPISMQWTNELRKNVGLHPSMASRFFSEASSILSNSGTKSD